MSFKKIIEGVVGSPIANSNWVCYFSDLYGLFCLWVIEFLVSCPPNWILMVYWKRPSIFRLQVIFHHHLIYNPW